MQPHPRIRKTIKWGGAAVTVLLVVVWMGSAWWGIGWKTTGFATVLVSGRLGVAYRFPVLRPNGLWTITDAGPLEWWFTRETSPLGYGWAGSVPLWVLCLASLIGTIFVWRRDSLAQRRARDRLNLCPKCNYDRTGLAPDAKCPECGH